MITALIEAVHFEVLNEILVVVGVDAISSAVVRLPFLPLLLRVFLGLSAEAILLAASFHALLPPFLGGCLLGHLEGTMVPALRAPQVVA